MRFPADPSTVIVKLRGINDPPPVWWIVCHMWRKGLWTIRHMVSYTPCEAVSSFSHYNQLKEGDIVWVARQPKRKDKHGKWRSIPGPLTWHPWGVRFASVCLPEFVYHIDPRTGRERDIPIRGSWTVEEIMVGKHLVERKDLRPHEGENE